MRYSLLILLFLFSFFSEASHIIGGNFEVSQTGSNDFKITLFVFRDCRPQAVQLSDLYISVFDQNTHAEVANQLLNVQPGQKITLGDECNTPSSLCVEQYIFEYNITLPDNPNGYTIAAQVCCRNSIIDNLVTPSQTGMTWSADIPDPAIQNNTPQLGPYPTKGFLCLNDLRTLDLRATDPDGDSLYYELVNPFTSSGSGGPISPPSAPPYNPVTWFAGYSANNAIPGNPPLTINPNTGIVECSASQLGLFVFAYSVSEYRNGQKIGEVRRDMQLQVLPCEVNQLPQFLSPQQLTYETKAHEETCIPIVVVDSNDLDSIYLISDFNAVPNYDGNSIPSSIQKSGFQEVRGTICYTPNCMDVSIVEKINITLKAVSFNCKYTDSITENLVISLKTINPDVEELFPNVFTPNGDGINDFFQLIEPISIPCLSDFEIRIFNRWGTLVYEHKGADFNWDGKYKAREASEGVFYFIINGSYTDEPFTYKNFLTLIR
ncbi:gliding motility-associated C-terminal domain-containing protein [Owenweeksia hongkongensis]|uniref:gliding motility-associated C-terminal domain-containing protein n=1 Tax=Owenweeksia hongkongensis TaxID=253245 RepID=UPI003A90FCCF